MGAVVFHWKPNKNPNLCAHRPRPACYYAIHSSFCYPFYPRPRSTGALLSQIADTGLSTRLPAYSLQFFAFHSIRSTSASWRSHPNSLCSILSPFISLLPFHFPSDPPARRRKARRGIAAHRFYCSSLCSIYPQTPK